MSLARRDDLEARSVVAYSEQQTAGLLPEPDRHCRLRGVLGGVLQRLQAAEIDRGLNVGRVPADASRGDDDRERAPASCCLERAGQAAVGEQRRIDTVC